MKHKLYRPNVAAVVLSSEYPAEVKIFLGRRKDMKNVWQFPQGGIDKGESTMQALLRELKEEIGTDDVDVLCECDKWLTYDFPKNALKRFHPFNGQMQKYFLVRLKFEGSVDINTQHPEFDRYKFVTLQDVLKHATNFKLPLYKKALDYFKSKNFI